jgi:hypothetical protein
LLHEGKEVRACSGEQCSNGIGGDLFLDGDGTVNIQNLVEINVFIVLGRI